MNRFLIALLVAAAAFSAGAPATAQEAAETPAAQPANPAGKEPSLAEIELGQQLVDLTGQRRTFDELLPNLADRAKTTFIRANPQMQLGIIDVVDKVALEMVGRRGALDAQLARTWALGFNEEQLKELIAFYSSDTGKRFAELHSRILAIQVMEGDRWARSVSEEMTQKIREELQAAIDAEARNLEGAAPALAPAVPAAVEAAGAEEADAAAPEAAAPAQ